MQAIGKVMDQLDVPLLANLPLYVVGEGTLAVSPIQFSTVVQGSGTAVSLAELVVRNSKVAAGSPLKPLLFLCGNLRRDDLPTILRENAVPFDELEVYETSNEDCNATAVSATTTPESSTNRAPQEPCWVVFFSPSGVDSVRQHADPSIRRSAIAARKVRCNFSPKLIEYMHHRHCTLSGKCVLLMSRRFYLCPLIIRLQSEEPLHRKWSSTLSSNLILLLLRRRQKDYSPPYRSKITKVNLEAGSCSSSN
jgi:hypothetical protein